MASPDIQITNDVFLKFGGSIFGKKVVTWDLRNQGVQVRTNVRTPQALTKLSAKGNPQPYSAADSTSGNGPKYTDRVLTAYQSKWDYDFDPEEFRNTYLADPNNETPFAQAAIEQVAKEYLAYIDSDVLYTGVRDANGTDAADITNGWGTLIAAAVIAGDLVEVATGALTNANAVTKVEQLVNDASFPLWMKKEGFIIYCSHATKAKYTQHYRTLNGFGFKANEVGDYPLDNENGVLRPVTWMGTSGRLIATVKDNLVFGTDLEQVDIASSMRRNILEVRQMMPVGCEIQDLEAMVINDQA